MQAADREQMREPRTAHRLRILFPNRPLVPGHEGGGDAALDAGQAIMDVAGQALAQAGKRPPRAPARRLRENRHRPQRLAGCTELPEPGDPRERIAPGTGTPARPAASGGP